MEKANNNYERIGKYLSTDITETKPAVRVEPAKGATVTKVVTDRLQDIYDVQGSEHEVMTGLNQAKLLTNIIYQLRFGELQPEQIAHLSRSDRKLIKLATRIVLFVIHDNLFKHTSGRPEIHAEERLKLADELEKHRDVILKKDVDARVDFPAYEAALEHPRGSSHRIIQYVETYLSNQKNIGAQEKVKSLKPNQMVKLSRHAVNIGGGTLSRSVFIAKSGDNELLKIVEYQSKTRFGNRSMEADEARLGAGGFNVAKRNLSEYGETVVSKKPLQDTEAHRIDQYNESHAVDKLKAAGARNVLLPIAKGRLAVTPEKKEKDSSTSAVKETDQIVYPFADGGGLTKRLATVDPHTHKVIPPDKPLDDETAGMMMKAIIGGVNEIHRLNMAHRDLKPENILLFRGMPRISDFGTVVDPLDSAHNALLPDRSNPAKYVGIKKIGTLPYIPPEGMTNNQTAAIEKEMDNNPTNMMVRVAYHQSADMWALGLILFQMMNTPNPEKGIEGGPMLLEKICAGKPEPLAAANVRQFDPTLAIFQDDFKTFRQNCEGRYSQEQVDLVLACFDLNPKNRPTIAEFAALF
jgi:hypothetical protein